VLTHWLILPLKGRRVHFSPERERYLELKEVVLLLAEGLDEKVGVVRLHCLVLESGATGNVVAVGVLDLDQDLLQIL
jgi:hypothetical protein